ncbi:MAG: hypothetical protein ABIW36_07950 [Terrimesophilobacter sp.]
MDRETYASMTGEQRAELERIAFGRTHSREDEEAAAAARKELAEADRAADTIGQEVLASQEPGAGSWSLAAALPEEELPPPPPEVPRNNGRRIHPAWLVPIIAGSIAAGYFGATIAVAGALQRPATATPSPSDKPSTVQLLATPEPQSDVAVPVREPGNLKEADAWFEAPQREVDGFIHPDMLQSMQIDPATTRFVQTNSAGFAAWVAKKLNGDLCVLGTDASGGAFAACSLRSDFERSGAMISQRDYTIRWNGSAVTVTNPRSQITP